MDKLPVELVGHLCLFLEPPSLCSFRLTCKAYAQIGEEHLFQNFEFRLVPNHHKLHLLKLLAAKPSIASRLRCVSLTSGVQLEYADYRYWQTQVYQDKTTAWERSVAARGASRDEYTQFHEQLQARFTADLPRKYDLYRWHLDQQAAAMAERDVRNKLMRILGSLKESSPDLRLKMIMAEPQIQLEELEGFDPDKFASDKPYDPDPRRRVSNRRRHCLDHFINFLDAANLSNCEVADLTAIDMPHQLLTVDHGLQVLEETFQGLRKLEMSVSAFPHSDWLARGGNGEVYYGGRNLAARRLRMLLNHPSSLEHLSLAFPVGQQSEYCFDLFDRTNLDRFPRLWLPHLRSLALHHFRCRWGDLRALLDEGRNLNSLALRDCRLETGSIIDLLEYLRSRQFRLAKLLGTWYVDEDCGQWHSHTESDFTGCSASTSYEGPYARAGTRSRVEGFIQGRGECPFPRWTVEDDPPRLWEETGDTSWHFLAGQPGH
ncbi:hypothetical protein CLCR_01556 [Cladophialophora carrionii]|uniref:F-box domain-containing protein n=1 Tax=Cladophialophora carrionii TaxID=86049 RepID=A0A1C1CB35_9EURO|nr:hypothetical protein CLCR_01556 [Cladophialophora carrionii]